MSFYITYTISGSVFFEEEWNGKDKSILSVGRIYPQKNHALLLRAFAQIHKSKPEFKLKICGKGSEENNLQKLANDLGIADSVCFMGEISNIREQLKSCSCFVLSSDYEGLPNALMEAMAVGVPVISTDCPCGGPRMLIKGNENGVLVPCGDVDKLGSAIEEVIGNRDKQLRLGRSGRDTALRFRTETVMNEWLSYLFTGSDCNG